MGCLTWNVRSGNQGKLEVVKQEVARVNVDILGISELKWTGMGEFNPDDHYIYYCGQGSLRRNGVAIMVNKRVRNAVVAAKSLQSCQTLCDPIDSSPLGSSVHGFSRQEYWSQVPLSSPQNAVLGCNLKNDRMISVCLQGKPFNITVILAYASTSNAEEAEVEWF